MKKIITILAAVFLMAMTPASTWSRNAVREPLVRAVTMNTGLPSNAVRSIVQDKNGFIWFGTDNGLCRYDGYQVQNFYNPQMKFDQYVMRDCWWVLPRGPSSLILKPNSFRN